MAGSVAAQVVTDLVNRRIPQVLMQEEFHKVVLYKPGQIVPGSAGGLLPLTVELSQIGDHIGDLLVLAETGECHLRAWH